MIRRSWIRRGIRPLRRSQAPASSPWPDCSPAPEIGATWRGRAQATLDYLCTDYLAHKDWHRGLLKHGCYSISHRDGVNSAVFVGDDFFVEALMAALSPGAFLLDPLRPGLFPYWAAAVRRRMGVGRLVGRPWCVTGQVKELRRLAGEDHD